MKNDFPITLIKTLIKPSKFWIAEYILFVFQHLCVFYPNNNTIEQNDWEKCFQRNMKEVISYQSD